MTGRTIAYGGSALGAIGLVLASSHKTAAGSLLIPSAVLLVIAGRLDISAGLAVRSRWFFNLALWLIAAFWLALGLALLL